MNSQRFVAEFESKNLPYAIIYPATKKNYVRLEYSIDVPDELSLAVKGIPASQYSKELKQEIYAFLTEVLKDLRMIPLQEQSDLIAERVHNYLDHHKQVITSAIRDRTPCNIAKYGKFVKFSHTSPVC